MRKLLLAVFLFAACRCSTTSDFARKTIDDAIRRSVWVDVTKADGTEGNCSGVVLETGKVLTAKHCAGLKMTVNGREAHIIALDAQDDLLLLKVESPEYSRVKIGPVPQVGERVFSVSTITDLPSIFSQGHVMKLAQQFGEYHIRPLVSVESAPGVSGGGLYDTAGRLVGVVVQYREAPFRGMDGATHFNLMCGAVVEGQEIDRFLKAVNV